MSICPKRAVRDSMRDRRISSYRLIAGCQLSTTVMGFAADSTGRASIDQRERRRVPALSDMFPASLAEAVQRPPGPHVDAAVGNRGCRVDVVLQVVDDERLEAAVGRQHRDLPL